MLKRLLLLSILIWSTASATEWGPANNGMTTLSTSGARALSRLGRRITVDNSGNWLINWGYGNSGQYRITRTGDQGANWTITNPSPSPGYFSHYGGLMSRGDSTFVMGIHPTAVDTVVIQKFNGTLAANNMARVLGVPAGGSRGGYDVSNDTMTVLQYYNGTTYDSTAAAQYVGNVQDGITWSLLDWFGLPTSNAVYAEGPRVPFGGMGILVVDHTAEDLFFCNKVGGLDTVLTGVSGWSSYNFTGTNGALIQFCHVSGDTGMYVGQEGTALNMVLFRLTGDVPNMTFSSIGTTTIEASGNLPTPITTAGAGNQITYAEPCITKLGLNGDSMLITYKFWADPTNYDSADVVSRVWVKSTNTLGSRSVIRSATNGQSIWQLNAPEWVPQISGAYVVPFVYADSNYLTADRDSAYVFNHTITVSDPPPPSGSTSNVLRNVQVNGILLR